MRRIVLAFISLILFAAPTRAQETGYGTIRFENETAFEIDLLVNNVTACRASPWSYCTTEVRVGGHYVSGRTVEATPRDSNADLIEVYDSTVSTWSLKGGGTPAPPPPQATGYGTIRFENQTVFDIDFHIDSAFACRSAPGSYCNAQARTGTRYVSGKTVEPTPRESSAEAITVPDGATVTYALSGGGPARTGYGTVEFRNATRFQIDFHLDGAYACRAAIGSTCSVQATVGTHQAFGRTVEEQPRSANGVTLEVADGQTSYYEMSGGGLPGDGGGTPAAGTGGSTGAPAVSGSPAPPTPQPQPQPQPTPAPEALRYGSIVFDNQTALPIDFYIDNVYACRTAPGGNCEFPAIAGRRNVAGVTRETSPRRIDGTADVPEGRSTTFGVVGQGADALPQR